MSNTHRYTSIRASTNPEEPMEETYRISMNITKMGISEDEAIELTEKISDVVDEFVKLKTRDRK